MNTLSAVPFWDWTVLLIGIAGFVLSYIESKDRLPKWAREWLSKIGRENVEQAIENAARLKGLSSAERRQEATAYLIRLSEKKLGFSMPESIANLLVEFVYQQWKRRV